MVDCCFTAINHDWTIVNETTLSKTIELISNTCVDDKCFIFLLDLLFVGFPIHFRKLSFVSQWIDYNLFIFSVNFTNQMSNNVSMKDGFKTNQHINTHLFLVYLHTRNERICWIQPITFCFNMMDWFKSPRILSLCLFHLTGAIS